MRQCSSVQHQHQQATALASHSAIQQHPQTALVCCIGQGETLDLSCLRCRRRHCTSATTTNTIPIISIFILILILFRARCSLLDIHSSVIYWITLDLSFLLSFLWINALLSFLSFPFLSLFGSDHCWRYCLIYVLTVNCVKMSCTMPTSTITTKPLNSFPFSANAGERIKATSKLVSETNWQTLAVRGCSGWWVRKWWEMVKRWWRYDWRVGSRRPNWDSRLSGETTITDKDSHHRRMPSLDVAAAVDWSASASRGDASTSNGEDGGGKSTKLVLLSLPVSQPACLFCGASDDGCSGNPCSELDKVRHSKCRMQIKRRTHRISQT